MIKKATFFHRFVLVFLKIYLISPEHALGQDSLLRLLDARNHDTIKIKAYYSLGSKYSYTDKDSSLYYTNQGLRLADKLERKNLQFQGQVRTANIYNLYFEIDSAKRYVLKAIHNPASVKDPKWLGTAYGCLANIYSNTGNYDSCIYARYKQVYFAELSKDQYFLSIAYSGLSNDFRSMFNWEKELEYCLKSVAIKERLGNSSSLSIGYVNLASAYQDNHKTEEALAFFQKALAIQLKLGEKRVLANIYEGLGSNYLDLNDKANALLNLNKAKALFEETGDMAGLINNHIVFSNYYKTSNDLKTTEEYLLKALSAARSIEDKYYVQHIYSLLHELYELRKDYKNSLEYYKLYVDANNKQKESELQEKVKRMELNYNSFKREQSSLLLQQRSKNLEAELNQKKIILYSVLVVGLLLIVLLVLILKQIKSRAFQKTADLEQKLLRSQMDPHFIFNSLNSIQAYILKNEPQEAYNYLTKFSRLIRLVLYNSQERTSSLSNEIQMLNIYVEIEQLRFTEKFDYKIEVDPDLDVLRVRIPTLLLQPYVENAIWHGLMPLKGSRRGKLMVKITQSEGKLHISIEDNGIGRAASRHIEKSPQHKSTGMSISEQRLNLLNKTNGFKDSKIEITDLYDPENNACGTVVDIVIPILYED
ncbi:MAG TPA: histidine kinase [Bacteroidia bacterium]|jgi:hypothetical protein